MQHKRRIREYRAHTRHRNSFTRLQRVHSQRGGNPIQDTAENKEFVGFADYVPLSALSPKRAGNEMGVSVKEPHPNPSRTRKPPSNLPNGHTAISIITGFIGYRNVTSPTKKEAYDNIAGAPVSTRWQMHKEQWPKEVPWHGVEQISYLLPRDLRERTGQWERGTWVESRHMDIVRHMKGFRTPVTDILRKDHMPYNKVLAHHRPYNTRIEAEATYHSIAGHTRLSHEGTRVED
ncbi:hypothetical protein DFH07DRAFT_772840 [Mycena maculata]|uniref:Uncharacterized protein n=1 Tax=Mycena maculata TaxID=230809 RepID=A0AAD7NED0_9AGAR|nr:hypothetical protein DFH07DRAFT_772840 [Mycena maculata]